MTVENENKPAPRKRTVKPKVVTTETVTTVETVTEEEVVVPALTAPPVTAAEAADAVPAAKPVPAPLPIPEDRSGEVPASFVRPSPKSGSSKPDSSFLFSKNITNKEYFAAGSAGLIVCLVFVLGFSFGLNFSNQSAEVYEISHEGGNNPSAGQTYEDFQDNKMFVPEDELNNDGPQQNKMFVPEDNSSWVDGYKNGFVDGYQLSQNNIYYGGVAYDSFGNVIDTGVKTMDDSDVQVGPNLLRGSGVPDGFGPQVQE